jgi:hypothetical protein
MNNKKITEALNKQIEKLEQENFNLDSWKSSTNILLERIFGKNNNKMEEIEKIIDDKSSWALRDSKGTPGIEKCKKQAREILDICITEIDLFGIESKDDYINPTFIPNVLKEKLKNSQYLEIKELLSSDKSDKIKHQLLKDYLKKVDILDELLASIIVQQEVIKKI